MRYFHSLFVDVGAGSRMHVLNVCSIKVLDCELLGSERVSKLYHEGFIPTLDKCCIVPIKQHNFHDCIKVSYKASYFVALQHKCPSTFKKCK